MANKRKLNKEERKRRRLQKGKQWLLTYQGTPKHMVKHYRERFHVDSMTAVKDLQELGVNYTQEQLDNIKRAEEERLKQKRLQKEKKKHEKYETIYEDCDDRFAFIAGFLPLTESMKSKAPYLSVGLFFLVSPVSISPVRSLNLLICEGDT